MQRLRGYEGGRDNKHTSFLGTLGGVGTSTESTEFFDIACASSDIL